METVEGAQPQLKEEKSMNYKRGILYLLLSFWIGFSVNLFAGFNIFSYQWWVIFIPFSVLFAAIILTDKQL